MVTMDKESYGAINPVVADHDRHTAGHNSDQCALQQFEER
jgi:hypothetical protein